MTTKRRPHVMVEGEPERCWCGPELRKKPDGSIVVQHRAGPTVITPSTARPWPEIKAEIGARLKAERKKAKLSLAQMAELVGATPSTVARIERGEFTSRWLILWAQALDMSLDALIADLSLQLGDDTRKRRHLARGSTALRKASKGPGDK